MTKQITGSSASSGLVRSRAGIRLIALISLFNRGDFTRIKQYLREQCHAEVFTSVSLVAQMAELRLLRRRFGRLRLTQIVGLSETQAIVLLETETGSTKLMVQIGVANDYPHLLEKLIFSPLGNLNEAVLEFTD